MSGVLRGIALAALFVAVNAVAAFNFLPSTYQQFTWEAYAEVVYTATSTPTTTPTTTQTTTPTATPTITATSTRTRTATATATATASATETPIPNGGSCATPSECQSGFCVDGICCNTICNEPGQSCQGGTCVSPAPVPAVSHRSLALIVALLVAIGFFALTPLRFGKRR